MGRIDTAAAERARGSRDEARATPNANAFNSRVHWCARNTRQSPGVLILLEAQAFQRGAGELFNPWPMYAVSHWAGELRRLRAGLRAVPAARCRTGGATAQPVSSPAQIVAATRIPRSAAAVSAGDP